MSLIRRAQPRTNLLSVAALTLLCICATVNAGGQSAPALSDDESAVYTALFKDVYQAAPSVPIILSDQTALGVPPGMLAKVPTEGLQTRAFLDKVSLDTKADYSQKEHVSIKLPSPCRLAPDCIAKNAGDIAVQVKNDKAWAKFYKRYPNSPGVVVVSRIGFNVEHTQALVYTGCACGTLCGQGEYARLAKRDGAWTVEDTTVVWISQK